MALKSSKMSVLSTILQAQSSHTPLLAVLVDPDKPFYQDLFPYLSGVDLVLVGGSTGGNAQACIAALREYTSAPVLLFPGNVQQFTPTVDALLFLTLLNSRRPEILIDPHVQMATTIHQSGVEVIPMGYVLVDGHRQSAVEKVSHCTPVPHDSIDEIVRFALAGQLLGKQLVYLEAGSGAKLPVSAQAIAAVKEAIHLPLIVGGGITSLEHMSQAFLSGADIVVIGNHFEQHPAQLPDFINHKNQCR
jgi:putative glycerol-1-phosphate prenyltransferase